ncbi:uncharacterized protein B0H18DRAFT_1009547 [Fomitopsis serialis]|uniref:uncharacterized protein n=1 Tax=Fomitopsis serialis TaxID=139415 RepID=UPI002008D270|nr:uncharacterized protein B0H18DRAFT_1009547 [Neoantrodia serialis]KAH9925301.1 hypothetical protein B0H18DRAFT_1009547 [Neoantrodia serialis]
MTVSDSSVLASAYLESAIYFSATALCCYDYCLTLGDEIQYVWTRKRPLSLLLFCGFRYPAVLNTIFVILGSRAWPGWQSNYSCLVLIRTEMVLNIVLLISAAVFTALRIYAIYGLKLSIFLIVFLLGIINPAIYMIYSLVALRPGLFTDGHIVFCASFSNSADRLSYMNWIIGARVSSLLADGLVLVLTWYKLFRVRSEAANACSTSLVSVLITDTGVYFL